MRSACSAGEVISCLTVGWCESRRPGAGYKMVLGEGWINGPRVLSQPHLGELGALDAAGAARWSRPFARTDYPPVAPRLLWPWRRQRVRVIKYIHPAPTEPPRDFRRLHHVRRWGHEKQHKAVFGRGTGASGAAGVRARARAPLLVRRSCASGSAKGTLPARSRQVPLGQILRRSAQERRPEQLRG